ncbi:Pfs, NACHT and ankyrin domain protein [Microdochium bolleyi]|uniref:Pfs, NACHT and ankyrin domain protein n=1 Tax=Microdochium bolleyi TaxID=196109 RepID=A0A136IJ54_9PEZI|nr:Pfs, NACHT and ankyrin domain protein [Microdochium bolleyi]
MSAPRALDNPDAYTIGWIAALPIERAAAEAMLDEDHAPPTSFVRHQSDTNVYTWGRLGEHNIVIASLAAGVYGTTSAATTASCLLASLPSIRIGLMVGIGGGIARLDKDQDIRLGDVVVSQPDGTTGGVCQYDLIKAKAGGKRDRKGFLRPPPTVLLNALAKIQADHERKDSKVPRYVQEMLEKNPKMGRKTKKSPGFAHQGFENDRLFQASYDHISGPDCRHCNADGEVQRDDRDITDPEIHYGIIASGNTLVKDAAERDRIVDDIGGDCLCFEMEAAGLMDHFPCLVIRGICDYADAHKNDRWQRYASATAAAYAKELLAYVPAVELQETKRALEVLHSVDQKIDDVQKSVTDTQRVASSIKTGLHSDKIERWLRPSDPSTNANHARKLRHEGTGAWLLEHPVFRSWKAGSCQHVWLHGLAGCGKTVLSTTVLDHLEERQDRLLLSFFFDFSDTSKQTVDGMLRSLAFQLYRTTAKCAMHLDALYGTHHDGRNQPTRETLLHVVCKMLASHERVVIILDALDESTTRGELVSGIKDIASRLESRHVQLICTSRPEPDFRCSMPELMGEGNCLKLDKHAVDGDIRSYVAAQLVERHEFRSKYLSQGLLKQIQSKVGDGADGMFRWAFCQLESLAQCLHETAVERALASLPHDLNETYGRMLEVIPAELKHDALRLLQFLVHSKRPLRLAEAVEVLATQIEGEIAGFNVRSRLFRETDVLRYCPGLVVIVHADVDELHLSHFSVKEYLLGIQQIKLPSASITIAMTCLAYLADIECSDAEIRQQFPMARFAAQVWTGFAAAAETAGSVLEASVRFLQGEATFQRWCRLYQQDTYWDDNPGPPKGSRLYYACFGGLSGTATSLLEKGADVNAQGGEYGNALQAASARGHEAIVRLLLAQEADVNAPDGAASDRGHDDIVKLLLANGADVNVKDDDFGQTPLSLPDEHG